jgi:hypothetical protein
MASDTQGSQARLYVEPGASAHTFDSNSESYEFNYESVQKHGRIVGGNGIRGTRSQPKERTRAGAYTVGGRISFTPDPAMLDLWLPRILGGSETADDFPVAETLPAFGLLFNRVTQTFQYTDCQVARAMFHGKAGPGDGDPDLIELVVEVMGLMEVTGTSAPSVTLSTASNAAPYVHSDATFSFVAATRQVKEWWVIIDNVLQPRWVNSISATRLSPNDRIVMVRTRHAYDDDHDDLYGQAVAGSSGTITLTNGNMSTLFTFATLQAPDNSPVIRGKTETDILVDARARTSTTTKEIRVTHDSTA